MDQDSLLKQLQGTDRRSIGNSNQAVARVLKSPRLFDVLFAGMMNDDPVVRMRAADAIEKISAARPELLQPHKRAILRDIARIRQPEVRWHCAQMFALLKLTPRERRAVIEILNEYLEDQSAIVKTFAMQALADLATQESNLRAPILVRLEELTRTGTPAMKSRGKKLLARFKK